MTSVVRDDAAEHSLAIRAKTDVQALTELRSLYVPLLHWIANQYFAHGLDQDDVDQEALIAFWVAVRDYDPARGVRFNTFARMVVERRVQSAIKGAQRGKHSPLNERLSLDAPVAGRALFGAMDDDLELHGALEDPRETDPVELLAQRGDLAELARFVRVDLSRLEAHSLLLFANGLTYDEIADTLAVRTKHIDQAISRARWKRNGGPPSQPERGGGFTTPRELGVCEECGGPTTWTGRARGQRVPAKLCNVCTLPGRRDDRGVLIQPDDSRLAA